MRARYIVLIAAAAGVLAIARFTAPGDRTANPAGATSAQGDPIVHRATFGPETAPVQVFVSRLTPAPGRVAYRYTVVNRSTFPVTTVLVGFDEYYGVARLRGCPEGWDGDSIPSTSYQAPPGWEFRVQPTEEDSLIAVKWVRTRGGSAIQPGGSLGGFLVVLPEADPAYDRGGLWTVYASGHEPFFGALQQGK